MIRGTTLLAMAVVLGLACVFGKGTDTEKRQESTSILLDIDPNVADGPGDEEKKDGQVNDPLFWRHRYRKSRRYRRSKPYPSRRPYPSHKPPYHTQKPYPTHARCSTSRPAGVKWVNEWHGKLFFECPKGNSLTYMKSDFSDCQKDRIWAFGCGYNKASEESCHWTHGYANQEKEGIFFNCPNHGFISGIDSIYTSAGDRQYRFKCCNDERFDHGDCRQSHHLNSAGQNFDFKVDRDRRFYITGISSCFDSEKKDRVWKIDYCRPVEEEGYVHPEKKDVIEKN